MLTAEHILVYAEPILVLAVFIAFLKSGFGRSLPAMRNYLVFRVVGTVVLEFLLQLQHLVSITAKLQCSIYFFAYWSLYLTGAVLIFLVIREIFGLLMQPVPQVRKLGMMAFHWVIAISCIIGAVIAVSAGLAPVSTLGQRLVYVAQLTLHSVSVLELCLLAFVALTIHSLGRSFRSPLFGISLGFGLKAASSFVVGALVAMQHAKVWSGANLLAEGLTCAILITWGVYFLLPEPAMERNVQVVPEPSPLIRWNDVAQALGHSSPRVAAGASTGFFLQDVERVVDRVLARNQALVVKSSDSKAG